MDLSYCKANSPSIQKAPWTAREGAWRYTSVAESVREPEKRAPLRASRDIFLLLSVLDRFGWIRPASC
jgi:hypothetical protein